MTRGSRKDEVSPGCFGELNARYLRLVGGWQFHTKGMRVITGELVGGSDVSRLAVQAWWT